MKNAQISIDFMITIAVVLIIFAFIITFAIDKKIESDKISKQINKLDFCMGVSDSIVNVFLNGVGTKITLNNNNNISISNNIIYIDDIPCSSSIKTDNVNLKDNKIVIENIDNKVVIKNV